MNNIVKLTELWNEQDGVFTLKLLPQRKSVESEAISTGWWEFDQIFRLYPGQFVVVTGIAGSGKSTLLLNVVCNVAVQYGMRSLLYVPENEQHLRDKLKWIWGDRPGFEYFCSDQCYVQSAVLDEYSSEPRTLTSILNKAKKYVQENNVDLLLLDPWNEIEKAKPYEMLMTDYIGLCLMWIKQFCRQHSVTVMLVAHPTKAGVSEGKVPSLADIEGSMNWYNRCDNGLIVVRDPEKPTCRVISAKVREQGAGRRGVCHFFVDPETGIFTPQPGGVSL